MSSSLQQGIFYTDRPMGYAQGTGVFATPEFGQFLERLSSMVRAGPDAGSTIQTQVDQNTASIATLNSEIATLQTTDAAQQAQINAMGTQVPRYYSLAAASAVALTSGTAATVLSQTIPTGNWAVFGAVYFTGSGTLTWGRASVGTNAAVIDTTTVGQAGAFIGSASPGTLGFDIPVGGFFFQWSGSAIAAYLNAEANFSGTVSAYGSLLMLQF